MSGWACEDVTYYGNGTILFRNTPKSPPETTEKLELVYRTDFLPGREFPCTDTLATVALGNTRLGASST